jgi:hypothetical protein
MYAEKKEIEETFRLIDNDEEIEMCELDLDDIVNDSDRGRKLVFYPERVLNHCVTLYNDLSNQSDPTFIAKKTGDTEKLNSLRYLFGLYDVKRKQ